MRENGLEPSSRTYKTLVIAYVKKRDINSVQKILKDCESMDLLLRDRDFMEIIYTLAATGQEEHIDSILLNIRGSFGSDIDATNTIIKYVILTMPTAPDLSGGGTSKKCWKEKFYMLILFIIFFSD